MIPMRDNRIGAIQVALGAIFWSFAGVLGKWLPWNAFTINGIRSLVAAILIGLSRRSFRVRLTKGTLLGALGEGDIGRHFPDTDPAYKGADSMKLLAVVMEKVRAAGYSVVNADVTIVAQRPKLAGYMDQMKASVAAGLGVDPSRVNVKATTTEKLGFEGEGLGISAQAVALLYK